MSIRNLIVLFLWTSLLFVISCGAAADQATESEQNVEEIPVDEDELIVNLSSLMSADTSRVGRDNNVLLNYAIDQLYEVELTNSGLLYQIIEEGEGASIAWGDFLKAHYKGAYLDGKVFANSQKNKQPLEFYVGNMIDAWNEGLQLIKVGGKIRLLVPSHLGYGEQGLIGSNGVEIVPPHQLLVFEVEVLEKSDNNE